MNFRVCCVGTGTRLRGRHLVVFILRFASASRSPAIVGLVRLLSRLRTGHQQIFARFTSTGYHCPWKVTPFFPPSTSMVICPKLDNYDPITFDSTGYERLISALSFRCWKRASETRRNWWKQFCANWNNYCNRPPECVQLCRTGSSSNSIINTLYIIRCLWSNAAVALLYAYGRLL